jgi:formylglycine-generating enzyme required for sulfatase activity
MNGRNAVGNERKAVGSGDHEDVPGSPYSTFPIKPHIDRISLGFRLAHDSTDRVDRGGSWNNSAQHARVAYRSRNDPANRGAYLGFRLVWQEDT